MTDQPICRSAVVEVEPARQRGQRSSYGSFGIVWAIDGADALWIPVVNRRAHEGARTRRENHQLVHRSDLLLDAAQAALCGLAMPRPVVECHRLWRRPLAAFQGRRVVGVVPEATMQAIYATMVQEARRLTEEIGRAA